MIYPSQTCYLEQREVPNKVHRQRVKQQRVKRQRVKQLRVKQQRVKQQSVKKCDKGANFFKILTSVTASIYLLLFRVRLG